MKKTLTLMLLTASLWTLGTPLFAQSRDPVQQKLDLFWNGPHSYSAHSAGNRIHDARQYTQRLYDYTAQAPAEHVVPAITKVESEHIGQTLQAAKQNLANIKKDATKPVDPAVVKKVEAIEKHLESALKHHKMMDMECCKDQVDGSSVSQCCDNLLTDLDKALAEQASLMRLLGVPSKPVVSPKTDAPKM